MIRTTGKTRKTVKRSGGKTIPAIGNVTGNSIPITVLEIDSYKRNEKSNARAMHLAKMDVLKRFKSINSGTYTAFNRSHPAICVYFRGKSTDSALIIDAEYAVVS